MVQIWGATHAQIGLYAVIFDAILGIEAGDSTAVADYLEADQNYANLNAKLYIPIFRAMASWNALSVGLLKESQTLASMARDMIDLTGEDFSLSNIYALEGAHCAVVGDLDAAENKLKLAVKVARDQNAKAWELRAAIDLARLLLEQDRADEGIATLKPVSESITDGDCSVDQKMAQDVLNSLRGKA